MDPLLLCIETATEVCSVCLSKGAEVLALRESYDRNDHAALLTTYIDDCVQKAKTSLDALDAIVVSRGPGSYTALRIGVSTAKGIGYALHKPLIAVPTLEALAQAAIAKQPGEKTRYLPMIDARRMEVYAALYDAQLQPVWAPEALVLAPELLDEWLDQGYEVVCCGNGAVKAKTVFTHSAVSFLDITCTAPHLIPGALASFQAGTFADLAYYEPFYLKPPNITTPKKRL